MDWSYRMRLVVVASAAFVAGPFAFACHGSQPSRGDAGQAGGDLGGRPTGEVRTSRQALTAGPSFQRAQSGLGSGDSNAVALADLDGNGTLDAFVAHGNGTGNAVWTNTGGGSFSLETNAIGSYDSRAVVAGDFNGDGRSDILVANGNSDHERLYTRDPNGSYFVLNKLRGDDATDIAAGDLDGDSYPEAIVSRGSSAASGAVVYERDQNGDLADSGRRIGSGASTHVALGDVTGDGVLDVVVESGSSANEPLVAYPNNGDGTFGSLGVTFGATASVDDVVLGDLDADGQAEAVTAEGGDIYVWEEGFDNNGNIDLVQAGKVTQPTAGPIRLNDVDLDGDLDLVVSNAGSGGTVLTNDGTGSFQTTNTSLGSKSTTDAALGDLDADGDLDAFVTNTSGADYVWFNQQTLRPDTTYSDSGQSLGKGNSRGVAVADVDRDGDLDVFVANSNGPNRFWENDGDGNFSTNAQMSASEDSQDVALGDLDADGDVDAFVVNSNGPNYIYWGGSGFSRSTNGIGSIGSLGVDMADFDRDGDRDVVVGNDNRNELYLNDGSGTFPAIDPFGDINSPTADVAFVDFDADGQLEVLTAQDDSSAPANIVWRRSSGALGWTEHATFGKSRTRALESADFDRDGQLDIVAANSDGANNGQTNKVWFFQSTGFTGVNIGSGKTLGVGVGDLDRDGYPDIVTVNDGGANEVWQNDRNGGFTATNQSLGSGNSRDVAVADFDGDGDLDAFVANDGANKVWMNTNAPEAAADTSSGDEDTSQTVDVLGNDRDIDGDTLSLKPSTFVQTSPSNGSLSLGAAGGTITYTPANNFHGTDSFEYRVTDTAGDTAVARVSVTVNPVNDAPDADDDSLTTAEDTAATIDVIDNDSDVEGDSLTVSVTSDPSSGTTSVSGGDITYTPDANFNGQDSFVYTASDGKGGSDTATVSVTVNPVNDPPVARDDSATLNEDTMVTVDVLSNDSDIEGDNLSASIVGQPSDGSASLQNNQITYTPDTDFNGGDSIRYRVDDGSGGTDRATLSLTVTPVNDPPVATDDSAKTDEDQSVTVDVLSNDSDVDGDSLTVTIAAQPTDGNASVSADKVVYTPDANYAGSDSLQYEVADGKGGTDQATVSVSVDAVNDAPTWTMPTPQGSVSAKEGQQLAFTLAADDVDDSMLTYNIDWGGSAPSGTMLDATSGDFTWTPGWEDEGVHTVVLEASDGDETIDRTIDIDVSVIDTDDDGVPDSWEMENGLDTDSKDSDGDGISDGEEVGPDPKSAPDTDEDGTIDALDSDADGDGVDDVDEAGDDDLSTPPVDTDGDGTPDYRDEDSDGDGVDDETDNCRIVPNPDQEDYDGNGVGALCDDDRDGDGLQNDVERADGLNPLNRDSDGDTIPDDVEYGGGDSARHSDEDEIPDALDKDSDGDGWPDSLEAGDEDPETAPIDTDGDGTADYRDDDSDDDTVPDESDNCRLVANEAQTDLDGDGVGDACANDIDGDGVPNESDVCKMVADDGETDTDGDGRGDACDPDADGDEVDNPEDNCPLTANPEQADRDGDGLGDACDSVDGRMPDAGGADVGSTTPSQSGCSAAGGAGPVGPWIPLGALLVWGAFGRVRRRLAGLGALVGLVGLTTGCFPPPPDIDYQGTGGGDVERVEDVCQNVDQLGESCMVGEGQCMRTGIRVCDPETGQITCSATPGEPSEEVCDGRDNDCDGVIDDLDGADAGVDLQTSLAHCGRCNIACTGRFAHGKATCMEGGCGLESCQEPYVDVNGIAGDGCECEKISEDTDETCDQIDDDCDGMIDEGCSASMSDAGPDASPTADTTDAQADGLADTAADGGM